jgi:hypothetical protein
MLLQGFHINNQRRNQRRRKRRIILSTIIVGNVRNNHCLILVAVSLILMIGNFGHQYNIYFSSMPTATAVRIELSTSHLKDRNWSLLRLRCRYGLHIENDIVNSKRLRVRGGADYYDDSFITTTNIESKRKDDNDNRDDDIALTNRIDDNDISDQSLGKSLVSWLFGDLFLNDRSVASPSVDLTMTTNHSSSVTQSTGRGGALIKHKTTFRNRFGLPFFQQTLFDIGRVAPVATRLFRDENNVNSNNIMGMNVRDNASSSGENDDDASLGTASTATTAFIKQRVKKSVMAGVKRVSREWWVDTWADHLPDDDAIDDRQIDLSTNVTQTIHIDDDYSNVAIVHNDGMKRVIDPRIPESSKRFNTSVGNTSVLPLVDEVLTTSADALEDNVVPANETFKVPSYEKEEPKLMSSLNKTLNDTSRKTHLTESPYISSGSVSVTSLGFVFVCNPHCLFSPSFFYPYTLLVENN